MREQYKELIRWAILFLLVLLVAYIFDGVASPVLTWLSQVLYQVVSAAGALDGAEMASGAFSHFGRTAVHFAAGGFAYTWLVHVPWRKGAGMAWALFLALRYGPVLMAALASPWFYLDAAVSLAAAWAGARFYEEKRYNEHLMGIRQRLHERLQLD